jgi:hypothetical protein
MAPLLEMAHMLPPANREEFYSIFHQLRLVQAETIFSALRLIRAQRETLEHLLSGPRDGEDPDELLFEVRESANAIISVLDALYRESGEGFSRALDKEYEVLSMSAQKAILDVWGSEAEGLYALSVEADASRLVGETSAGRDAAGTRWLESVQPRLEALEETVQRLVAQVQDVATPTPTAQRYLSATQIRQTARAQGASGRLLEALLGDEHVVTITALDEEHVPFLFAAGVEVAGGAGASRASSRMTERQLHGWREAVKRKLARGELRLVATAAVLPQMAPDVLEAWEFAAARDESAVTLLSSGQTLQLAVVSAGLSEASRARPGDTGAGLMMARVTNVGQEGERSRDYLVGSRDSGRPVQNVEGAAATQLVEAVAEVVSGVSPSGAATPWEQLRAAGRVRRPGVE